MRTEAPKTSHDPAGNDPAVPGATRTRRCPQCGRQYPVDYLFCPDDAADLTDAADAGDGAGTRRKSGTVEPLVRTAWVLGALVVCLVIALGILSSRRHTSSASDRGISGAVSGSGTSGTSAAPADTWQRYSNDQLGFSMDVPPDWLPPRITDLGKTTGDGHMVTAVFLPHPKASSSAGDLAGNSDDATLSVPHAHVAVDLEATGLDAAGDWRDLDARFRRVYGDRYRLIGIQDSTVDGRAASTWQFVLQKKGQPVLERLDVGTFSGGRRHAFLFLAPPDQFAAWQPRFQHMIQSIRWR